MGQLTFGEAIKEIQAATGNESNDFKLIIKRVYNRKRRLVAKQHKATAQQSSYTLSLAAGQSSYDLSSAVAFVERGYGADGRLIEAMDEAIFRDEYGDQEGEPGPPVILRQYGRDGELNLTLKMWPVPDEAEEITLLVQTQPAWLGEDNETSEMDDAFDDVALAQAIAYCQVLNQDEMAQISSNLAKGGMDVLKGADQTVRGGQRYQNIKQDASIEVRRAE